MSLSIIVLNDEHAKEVTVADVTAAMNRRFTTAEQFEMRLDCICVEVAQELGGHYYFDTATGKRMFNFSRNILTAEGVASLAKRL